MSEGNLRYEQPYSGERRNQTKDKWKGTRRVLAASATAFVLSRIPVVGQAAADILQTAGKDASSILNYAQTDAYKPAATEVHKDGTVKIMFTQDQSGEIFPHLRENPILHNGSDGMPPNIIQIQDIKKINQTDVNLKPGSIIEIKDFTTVTAGENPDNPGTNGQWGVVEITRNDGKEEPAYFSLSGKTNGYITIQHEGRTQTLSGQPDQNVNVVIEDNLP